ncbi:hypothetical protein [Photobacterium damselae]|uniref:hypothetical protein n=1 Tax=Photobacterium damselae TaxID=38293 RepID=UPI004068774B
MVEHSRLKFNGCFIMNGDMFAKASDGVWNMLQQSPMGWGMMAVALLLFCILKRMSQH